MSDPERGDNQDVEFEGMSRQELIRLAKRAKRAKRPSKTLEELQAAHAGRSNAEAFEILAFVEGDDHGQRVACKCACGAGFERYTSDIHTGRGCPACTEVHTKGAAKRRRAAAKKANSLMAKLAKKGISLEQLEGMTDDEARAVLS